MRLLKQNKSLSLLIACIVLCLLPALWSLLHPGFFVSDDGSWMIVRFSAFYDNLKHGQFPVRFLSRLNFGYGYPVADFLYPLFMYIGIPIKVIGFNFITTVKIIFGISVLLSGVFSFLWLRKSFSQIASFAGGISYAVFPYYMWDIYKRGSIGEVLALSFVPFILWQIERESIVLVALGIGLLITAHNVIALFFLPISIAYVYITKKLSIKQVIFVTLLGLGLAAFFWLPALWDKQYTLFDTIAVSDVSAYLLQFQQYTLFGLIAIIAIIHSLVFYKKEKKHNFFLALAVLSILFTLPVTKNVWNILPGTNLIQFPFRLLSITMLCTGFLVAYVIDHVGKKKLLACGIYVVIIYISCWKFLAPISFVNYPDAYYTTNVDSTTVKNEYLPKWVTKPSKNLPKDKIQVLSGSTTIGAIGGNPNRLFFTISPVAKTVIQVNTLYFPGWEVSVNGEMYPFSYTNPLGVMTMVFEPGIYQVVVQFHETIARLIADVISMCSIFVIVGMSVLKKKSK